MSSARFHTERMLSGYIPPPNKGDIIRFQFELRTMAQSTLALILWLQGFPDQAGRLAARNFEDCRILDHALTLTYAATEAAHLATVLLGDLSTAERYLAVLKEQAAKRPWTAARLWASSIENILTIKKGEPARGAAALQATLSEFGRVGSSSAGQVSFLVQLAEGWRLAGDTSKALAAADRAVDQTAREHSLSFWPEVQRVKGEGHFLAGDTAAAEACFNEALAAAKREGALSWELRAATSLSRMWLSLNRRGDALALLSPIYARFTEGFSTRDLVEARELLEDLR